MLVRPDGFVAMTLRVRPALHDDAGLLARWAIAMALETEARTLAPEAVLAGVEAGIADPDRARYFIAMDEALAGGRETIAMPAGTLMLTREWSDWRNGYWWWIQSVYVAPDHRRRGVFVGLYRHIEQLARATPDVIGLRLYVERDNTAAQQTYAAMGMLDAGYRIYEAATAGE